jgi:hypothetical protein
MSLISILTIGQPRSNSGWDSNAASLRVFNLANMNWPSLVSTEIDGYPRSVFEYTQNGVPQLFQSAYPVSTIRTMAGGTVVGVQSDDPYLFLTNNLPVDFQIPTNGGVNPGVYTVRAYTENPTQGGVLVDGCTWEAYTTVPLDGCSFLINTAGPSVGTGLRFFSGDVTGLFSWIVKCTTPLGGISERPFNMTVIPS